MIKKLVAKTQRILPKTPQYTGIFSDVITSTPEDEGILKRKGTVYGVFEVSGPMEFETSVISKTISDILQDSYFQSENISPVQSLEKAILDAKEKLTKLNENTLREKSTDLKLNIVAAVLWGNVLYVVQHGEGNVIIMREGETKPVGFHSEGNFSSASGIVKNDDVVVISTASFGAKFPPEVLLRAGPDTFQDLSPDASCLMIKFSIDTAFTPSEQIDFGLKKKKAPTIDIKKLKAKLLQKNPEKKGTEEIVSIMAARKAFRPKGFKRFLIPVLLVGFAVSVVFTVKSGLGKKGEHKEETTTEKETKIVLDETTKDESFFYDLTLVDTSVASTSIAVTGEKVLVSDETTGKIYVSDIGTPQFSLLKDQFPGISGMMFKEGLINFRDKDGYRTYDVATGTAKEFIKAEGLKITYPYLEFVYELSGDSIYKYTDTGEKTTWAQSPDLTGGVSMVVDMSIYVLKGTEVLKYTSGVEDTFELKGMDMPLNTPSQIVLAPGADALYIADNGNTSIVVLDMEGNFKQRLYHQDKTTWGNIKGTSIAPDGEKLFVLNGTSVYEVSL